MVGVRLPTHNTLKTNKMVQEKQLKELFKYIEANWDVCVSQVDKTDIKRIFGGVLCDDIMNDTLHEVKAEPAPQHEKTNKIEITPYALIELNRAFCVLKDDESIKLHNFFGNDAINEIKQVYEAYFRGKERQIKPEEANPQPKLKFKIGDRLINFNKGGSYGNVCKLLANCPFELYDINTKTYFITNSLSGYELYTEPTEQPAKPFDKERFESIYLAVVAGGQHIDDLMATENTIKLLDAYYASKEGGSNE